MLAHVTCSSSKPMNSSKPFIWNPSSSSSSPKGTLSIYWTNGAWHLEHPTLPETLLAVFWIHETSWTYSQYLDFVRVLTFFIELWIFGTCHASESVKLAAFCQYRPPSKEKWLSCGKPQKENRNAVSFGLLRLLRILKILPKWHPASGTNEHLVPMPMAKGAFWRPNDNKRQGSWGSDKEVESKTNKVRH